MEKVGVRKDLDFVEEEALNEVRDYTREILKQLDTEIREGTYGAIIGDDATGRLPALLMWKIIGAVNDAAGRPRPILRFIAGSTGLPSGIPEYAEKRDAIVDHLGRIRKDMETAGIPHERKALIVTDTVARGRSINLLMGGIKKNNWKADVASLIAIDSGRAREMADAWGCKIATSYGPAPMLYLDARHLSGVTKSSYDVFARPYHEYLDEQWPTPERKAEEAKISRAQKAARARITKMAEALAKDFLKKKK